MAGEAAGRLSVPRQEASRLTCRRSCSRARPVNPPPDGSGSPGPPRPMRGSSGRSRSRCRSRRPLRRDGRRRDSGSIPRRPGALEDLETFLAGETERRARAGIRQDMKNRPLQCLGLLAFDDRPRPLIDADDEHTPQESDPDHRAVHVPHAWSGRRGGHRGGWRRGRRAGRRWIGCRHFAPLLPRFVPYTFGRIKLSI